MIWICQWTNLCCRIPPRRAASDTTSLCRALRCCRCCSRFLPSPWQRWGQRSACLRPPAWWGSPPRRSRNTPPWRRSDSPSAAQPPPSPPPPRSLCSRSQTGSWWAPASWTTNARPAQFSGRSFRPGGGAPCPPAAPWSRTGSSRCRAPAAASGCAPPTCGGGAGGGSAQWAAERWDQWGSRRGRRAGSRVVWASCLGRMWPGGGGLCGLGWNAPQIQGQRLLLRLLWSSLQWTGVWSPGAASASCTWRWEFCEISQSRYSPISRHLQ